MFRHAALLIVLALHTLACGPEQPLEEPVVFEQKVISVASTYCGGDSSKCTIAQAEFPRVASGPETVKQRINDSISAEVAVLLDPIGEESEAAVMDPEQAARAFIASYDRFMKDQPDYGYPWSMELKGEVLHRKDSLASVKLWSFSFSGGAHPNTFVSILNFNLVNGQSVDLREWITDQVGFEQVVKEAFRRARELEPGADLQEAGFFWDGSFQLPEQIGLKPEGFYFFYNSYEVAAYSMGPTAFVVPYEQLKPFLQESTPDLI